MRNINKLVLALAIAFTSTGAYAGNDNGPSFFGDTTNNNQTYNQPTANGGTGYGGNATAVGQGGSATGGSATIGDIRNTNTALGGAGGSVLGSGNSDNTNVNTAFGGQGGRGGDGGTGIGFGGSANQGQAQGQQQGQGQSQSNVGINGQSQGQSSSNVNSTSTSTSTATNTSTATKTNQSQSSTANNAGNSQSVGGQSTSVGGQSVTINEAEIPDDVTVRQAPSMIVTAPNATVSCYKTFGGSLSGILGGAGLSGGKIDESCEFRETVRIAASVDRDGAAKMLCLSELYSIANPAKCAGVRPVFITDGKAGRQVRANRAAK